MLNTPLFPQEQTATHAQWRPLKFMMCDGLRSKPCKGILIFLAPVNDHCVKEGQAEEAAAASNAAAFFLS